MTSYQGIEDNYLPTDSKPSLQQYDNYQIHDLYCEDIIYQAIEGTSFVPDPVRNRRFLAVERVSPHGSIECNFEAIATAHP